MNVPPGDHVADAVVEPSPVPVSAFDASPSDLADGEVVDIVDGLNADNVVRIHGVGFAFKGERGELYSTVHRFSTLMRVLCQRNGGTFVALGKES